MQDLNNSGPNDKWKSLVSEKMQSQFIGKRMIDRSEWYCEDER